MIGAHNTLTAYPATSLFTQLFQRWWKCQRHELEQLYFAGVRFFDMRVRWNGIQWQGCHGLADVDAAFRSLDHMCQYMNAFPDLLWRIVLERGSKADCQRFINEAHGLCSLYPRLWRVDIKSHHEWLGTVCNNNNTLYDAGYLFARSNTWDYPSHELHGSLTWRNLLTISLRREAKRINTELVTQNGLTFMRNTKERLWLIDFASMKY